MLEKDTTPSSAEELIRQRREMIEQRKKQQGNLFLRNIFNTAFILLAALAMLGIVVFPAGSKYLPYCYGLGIVAVLIKMVEVLLRMPMFADGTFTKAFSNFHKSKKSND